MGSTNRVAAGEVPDVVAEPAFDPKALVDKMIDGVEEPKPGVGSQAEVDALLGQGKVTTEGEPKPGGPEG